MRTTLVGAAFLSGILPACSEPSSMPDQAPGSPVALPGTGVVDLTYPFDSETIYWPTEEGFQRQVTAEGVTEQGYFYAAGHFSSAEHGGTHVDAPIHFAEGGQSVDEIPLSQMMGAAIVIDVSERAAANPDYLIEVGDITNWEAANGVIPDGSIVLFRTGFGRFWPDRQRYLGTDQSGRQAVADLHFPGLDPDAAQWILDNRGVKAVGIDTPSIDYGQSQLFETHQLLGRMNIPIFENVANLSQIPVRGSVVVALPMKIGGGSGAPLRIVAFVP